MRELGRDYFHPKGCGIVALRQLCDKTDQEIMSAAINNGYDPEKGGINPYCFRDTARQLGIKLSNFMEPRRPISFAELVEMSKAWQVTFVAGVKEHVLVVDKGEIADSAFTLPWERIEVIMYKKEEANARPDH